MKQNIFTLGILFVILTFFTSCSKDDAELTTIAEILVTNEGGQPLGGATVNLYSSKTDWETESNPVGTAETGADGIAQVQLVSAGSFFIDAQRGTFNNWEGNLNITCVEKETTNATAILKENNWGFLSSASGKKWQLKSVEVPLIGDVFGLLMPECQQDNLYVLYKNNKAEFDAGDEKCDPSEEQVTNGSWVIEEGVLKITPDEGTAIELTITEITSSKIEGEITIAGVAVPAAAVFERK